jgi:hypothetical protein
MTIHSESKNQIESQAILPWERRKHWETNLEERHGEITGGCKDLLVRYHSEDPLGDIKAGVRIPKRPNIQSSFTKPLFISSSDTDFLTTLLYKCHTAKDS